VTRAVIRGRDTGTEKKFGDAAKTPKAEKVKALSVWPCKYVDGSYRKPIVWSWSDKDQCFIAAILLGTYIKKLGDVDLAQDVYDKKGANGGERRECKTSLRIRAQAEQRKSLDGGAKFKQTHHFRRKKKTNRSIWFPKDKRRGGTPSLVFKQKTPVEEVIATGKRRCQYEIVERVQTLFLV